MSDKGIRPHTLDLQGCRDMVEKLVRERRRIVTAGSREDLNDHVVNFALTAWHLVEWVWAEIKNDHKLRLSLAKALGLPPQEFDARKFADWCRNECPDLISCQVVATATKHVACDPSAVPEAAEIKAKVSLAGLSPDITPIGETVYLALLRDGAWIAKITVKGVPQPAIPIFDRVIEFWTQFVHRNKIG